MSALSSARRQGRRTLEALLARRGLGLVRLDDQELAWRSALVDATLEIPAAVAGRLRPDEPRLLELRRAYDALDWPVVVHSQWQHDKLEAWLDLERFRGDNAYVWHYRETQRLTELKFFVFLEQVEAIDRHGLVERLGEDGAFGCWTYEFPGHPRCSRDLLDAVNELSFLDRHLGVLASSGLRMLDVGAGYGRLAHRTAQALPSLGDYCCVDAIPHSTFLCELYTDWRGVAPPVRTVALPDVPTLAPGAFDLAVNVHSFSECPLAAIEWWLAQLARLEVPHLFLVPNEAEGFLSREPDGTRRDYGAAIEAAGFRLQAEERAFPDPAARELLAVHDRHCLFVRAG